jgi:cation-transporting ATPase 13A1
VDIPDSILQVDLEDLEEEDLQRDSATGKDKKDANAPRVPDRAISADNVPSSLPTHARVAPAKGIDILVPLVYYPTLGMTFEYHRRRYVYQPDVGMWSKIRCRTDFELQFLDVWTGFASVHQLLTGQIRYGPNMFSVKQPTFTELYKKQLLNPFSVFQVFCVLLWAIDDYLIYSLFSLFMVLTFEGTVVFQRLKSLQALRGMGNPSRNILVFRSNHWSAVDSSELLPGDIMSLTRVKPHHVKQDAAVATANGANKPKPPKPNLKVEDQGGDVVPADLLLLRGSTVVNEASLTGESVPQMKEGLTELEPGESLGMKGRHKMNVVYAGTTMLQCKGATDYLNEGISDDGNSSNGSGATKLYSQIPAPPDNGCVCFVLRTGFASAQGKLVRMIEGSQEKVKGHERETGLLLLLLCFFAVVSSSYVLYHGMHDENRSKYELLLHCIMIVTSVIRPELPMQMAMAVNNSLMTLMKMHVFCTEPYRVPMAGKLDACLFDKTGTLTTDELVAVGVCEPSKLNTPKGKEDDDEHFMTFMMKVSNEAALVLAGCHSLVVYDDETTGDPLESAALNSMRWHISLSSGNAVPAPATEKKPAGKTITLGSGHQVSEIEILTRHHFSSKLQRMSCVIKAGSKKYSAAKGSPEAIGALLQSKPNGYDEKAGYLSKQGYRVIALAFKPLESDAAVQSAQDTRASCETNLIFAGFMVFTCKVRKDTAFVLDRLKEGGMTVAMVTGDALLTAIHVAKEVHICEPLEPTDLPDEAPETNEELQALLEAKRRQKGLKAKNDASNKHKTFKPVAYLDTTEKNVLYWCSYEDGSSIEDYSASRLPELSEQYDLATTGKCLALAFECDPDTTKVLQHIKVFARMTPDAKETVIECLHSLNLLCLMCGDGANDVGALKQADVGVALLTGFGNMNVDKAEDEEEKKKAEKKESTAPTAIMSQAHLDEVRALPVMLIKAKIRALGVDPDKYPDLVEKNDLVQLYQIKAREEAVKRHDKKNELDRSKMTKVELNAAKRADMADKQRRMGLRAAELEAQGVPWATLKAMNEFYAAEMAEAKSKKASNMGGRGIEGSAATLAAQFEDMEADSGLPMIKLGDASIAAPFTSKKPSISSCVDIVRQGRCTLVSSIQMVR